MGELTLGIVLEPDTHSLAHCMLLRAYLIYSFLLLNDLFQFHLVFLLDAPQHISVNGFVRPWGVFGGGPPSGRPVFGAFPPRWLCVLPYRSLLLQQHTILQKEKDSRENGAELSKQ